MKNIIKWVLIGIFWLTSFVSASDVEYAENMGLLECLEFVLKKAKETLVETGMNLALQVESKYYQVLKTIAIINNKKDSCEWLRQKEYAGARFNLETVRMEMNLALGRDLDQFFQLKDQEFPYESVEINLTEATQYALKNGKNVQKARENLTKAQENLKFKIESESAQIEIITAKQKLTATEIKLKRIEAETIIEIRNAYIRFRSAKDMIRDAENTYVQASEELEVLSAKYEAGMVSLIKLIDGQQELADAEVKSIESIYDYNLMKTSFKQLMGKGYSLYRQIVHRTGISRKKGPVNL